MAEQDAAPGLRHTPRVDPSAFVAGNATVLGDVTLAEHASVWFGAVLRADQNSIAVGAGSNVQDNAVLHADRPDYPGEPVLIGAGVTVGHGCVLHGCQVGDGALVGNGAVVLDGVRIGAGALVAAGALVPPGFEVPAGHLAVGNPAKVVRPLREAEAANLVRAALTYRDLAAAHRAAGHHRD